MNKTKIKTKDLESPTHLRKCFESIKKRSKKLYFSKLILKYKNNIKKTWQVIKEAIGKEKYKQDLPKKILESIAESFNILLKLVQNWQKILIGTSTKNFNEYIKKHDTT